MKTLQPGRGYLVRMRWPNPFLAVDGPADDARSVFPVQRVITIPERMG